MLLPFSWGEPTGMPPSTAGETSGLQLVVALRLSLEDPRKRTGERDLVARPLAGLLLLRLAERGEEVGDAGGLAETASRLSSRSPSSPAPPSSPSPSPPLTPPPWQPISPPEDRWHESVISCAAATPTKEPSRELATCAAYILTTSLSWRCLTSSA